VRKLLINFELYVQRDNTVVMLDFDKYGHRLTNTSHYTMPRHIHVSPEVFFQHASFPQGFEGAVGNPFRVSRLH